MKKQQSLIDNGENESEIENEKQSDDDKTDETVQRKRAIDDKQSSLDDSLRSHEEDDEDTIPLSSDLFIAICLEKNVAIKPKVLGQQYATSLLDHLTLNETLFTDPIVFAKLSPPEMQITHYLLRKLF